MNKKLVLFFFKIFGYEPFFKISIKFVTTLLFFMLWFFGCKACGILNLCPKIEPMPPALEGMS